MRNTRCTQYSFVCRDAFIAYLMRIRCTIARCMCLFAAPATASGSSVGGGGRGYGSHGRCAKKERQFESFHFAGELNSPWLLCPCRTFCLFLLIDKHSFIVRTDTVSSYNYDSHELINKKKKKSERKPKQHKCRALTVRIVGVCDIENR